MQPARARSLNLAGPHRGLPQAPAPQQHHPRWPTRAAYPALPIPLVTLTQGGPAPLKACGSSTMLQCILSKMLVQLSP